MNLYPGIEGNLASGLRWLESLLQGHEVTKRWYP